MLIDTHVHLQEAAYDGDLEGVLKRAAASGVLKAIVPGTDVNDNRVGVQLATSYADAACGVYAAVGIHPTNAHTLTADALDELRELAAHPRVVAIGEIGLDYYWPTVENRGWISADPETQRLAFDRQLALASELRLPVIVHDRDAHQDVLAMLAAWRERDPEARGVLHAYAGGPDRLQSVLDLGMYIGMDGPVTYRNAAKLHEVARRVPLDRLLLETDGPYLTPVPHRGKRNEPGFVPLIAERIAELKDIKVDTVAQATTANAVRLFRL
ncbi:MAG: TatD family hydrolase [Anaerolineae bacterium]